MLKTIIKFSDKRFIGYDEEGKKLWSVIHIGFLYLKLHEELSKFPLSCLKVSWESLVKYLKGSTHNLQIFTEDEGHIPPIQVRIVLHYSEKTLRHRAYCFGRSVSVYEKNFPLLKKEDVYSLLLLKIKKNVFGCENPKGITFQVERT